METITLVLWMSLEKYVLSLLEDKAQAEQGIQDAQGFAIQGETNATGLKTSLQGWQTFLVPRSDAPTWEIDLLAQILEDGKLI
ncbi:MAG: hypothetical protein IPL32_19765 [Chloracidobacterium sp.]|nr:hypothetical protein [Chloracidobacterium sp.]